MNKKKNIDDLFKEGFKNFEASPSPHVWNNIQAKLEEKEERRVIPLWIKIGSVAALLALLITVGVSYFNNPLQKQSNPIVNEDSKQQENSNESITNQEEIVFEDSQDLINTSGSSNTNNTHTSNTNIAVEDEKSTFINKGAKANTIEAPKDGKVTNAIAQQQNKSKNTSNSNTNNRSEIIKEPETNAVSKEAVASENVNKEINSAISEPNSESNTKETTVAETTVSEEENKKSIFDAIEETTMEEDAIANLEDTPDNRWEVMPNVGPVYYNTIGEGSSIDPSFSDNPKNGDVNIAYGVQVSYNLNKRLSVRSGLSNVNLSYSTTGIEIGNGPEAVALKSVDYNRKENVLITLDKGSLMNQNPSGEFGTITPKSTSGEPSLNQELNYFEVPLELKYAVLNNKFGVNLIGGFSTLFLGENKVFVEAGDFNETLGEANNLSPVSFTTNIGLGLNYSFSKKLMFNIEPMFKYQLNPYSDNSVDFNPYYVGIYSGLSFKF